MKETEEARETIDVSGRIMAYFSHPMADAQEIDHLFD